MLCGLLLLVQDTILKYAKNRFINEYQQTHERLLYTLLRCIAPMFNVNDILI